MYNTLSYILFLTIIFIIIFKIGNVLYKNGFLFIMKSFQNDFEKSTATNKILRIGFYLVNLGYASLSIIFWQNIKTVGEMILVIISELGILILLLGIMHYINILVIKNLKSK